MRTPSDMLREWRRSITALAFQITQLNQHANLLGEPATLRGEYFFADYGTPMPRPATALAWASLCAFGPVGGFELLTDSLIRMQPYDPRKGLFLLPFLPKIRFGEETSQSLIRTSRAHEKDPAGRIRWGAVFIADAASGQIVEQLAHGSRNAKEWIDHAPFGFHMVTREQSIVPPLWAYAGEGWQFGVIQAMPSVPMTLRDPMIELARRGIIELNHAGRLVPPVTRLLIRFLETQAAQKWAESYSRSMQSIYDSGAAHADIQELVDEIRQAGEKKRQAESKKKGGLPATFDLGLDKLMEDL